MGTVISDSQTMLLLVGPKDAFNTGSQSVGPAIVHVGDVLKIPVFKFEFDFLRPHELEDMIANIATKGKAESRPCLLFGGSHLEDHITLCALYGLAEGLEVHLLKDCVTSQQPQFDFVYIAKLVQAGVVPTTLAQFLLQWSALEPDDAKRIRLREMSSSFFT
jgi:hypothetical protein